MSASTSAAPSNRVRWLGDEAVGNKPPTPIPEEQTQTTEPLNLSSASNNNNNNNDSNKKTSTSGNRDNAVGSGDPKIIIGDDDSLINYLNYDRDTLQSVLNHEVFPKLNDIQRKKILALETKGLSRALAWMDAVVENSDLPFTAPFDGFTEWELDKDLQHVVFHPKFEYVDFESKILIFTLNSENLHRLLNWFIYYDRDPYSLIRKLAQLQGTI
ncbi:hypothetical protein TRICI_002893 [Trichomonascus ciferrii]|uniref:Uncharacterized protein n=1 Tax=Trichomonascus ciferrii TaxID=44093 RepID=A0A642V4N2_9ASCO|nr:hypothetical protein TRICI_002893 [Trichomonascus ciferrii]